MPTVLLVAVASNLSVKARSGSLFWSLGALAD